MPRFAGEIDFATLGRFEIRTSANGHARSVETPGLRIVWDDRHASAAWRDGVLVLAGGRARDGTRSAMSEAERWLDRYRARGESAIDDVGGAFAVVVIDVARRRTLAFVDRFGMESLCYRSSEHRFAFADRVVDVPGSARAIDKQALFDYLYFHEIPGTRTIFDDVRRLEAAHRVVVDATGSSVSRYWRPVFVEDDDRALPERMNRFVDLVRRAIDEEADDPSTACFLSGGTDSSTVSGMLTRLRGAPAHAYSIGFEADGYDEMAYARIAARHFGLVHHEYYLTPADLVEAIPRVAAALDQPFGNSSLLPAYFCALRAREDGFTRMLAGDGGDELFGGNSRYALQGAFELYHALPGGLRRNVLEPFADMTALRRVPGLRQVGGYVRHARVVMPDRLNAFNLLFFVGLDRVLDPGFLAEVDVDEPLVHQRSVWNGVTARSLVNRMLAYDWKFTLADSDLPKVRAATQLAGVTVGYPFLSRDLADFSLRLPPRWKVRGHRLRWFFKRALREFLPVEILRKKKHGFGLPFGAWLLQHAGLRDFAAAALERTRSRGIVHPTIVDDLLGGLVRQFPAFYGELVWILMMLELWSQTHVDGKFQAPPPAPAGVLVEAVR